MLRSCCKKKLAKCLNLPVDLHGLSLTCTLILNYWVFSVLSVGLRETSDFHNYSSVDPVAQWIRCCATNRKVAGSILSLLLTAERRVCASTGHRSEFSVVYSTRRVKWSVVLSGGSVCFCGLRQMKQTRQRWMTAWIRYYAYSSRKVHESAPLKFMNGFTTHWDYHSRKYGWLKLMEHAETSILNWVLTTMQIRS